MDGPGIHACEAGKPHIGPHAIAGALDSSPPVILTATTTETPRPRVPRVARLAILAGVIVVCVLFLGGAIAIALIDEYPAWWRTVDAEDPKTVETAEFVENYLVSVASRVRPMDDTGRSDRWGISVEADQANAWLNTRLRDWIANQRRGEEFFGLVDEVQVEFANNRLVVGASVRHKGAQKVVSATLEPEVREDGSLWLIARSVHLGRLPLPGWVLNDLVEAEEPNVQPVVRPVTEELGDAQATPEAFDLRDLPETRTLATAFLGRRPVLETPLIKLPDGRKVQLIALRADRSHGLVAECRTVAASQSH